MHTELNQKTFLQFSEENSIYLESLPANDHKITRERIFSKNPEPFKWTCKLVMNGKKSAGFDYSMGIGHVEKFGRVDAAKKTWGRASSEELKKSLVFNESFFSGSVFRAAPPNISDFLQCLALDSYAMQCDFFEDWAQEFGYDTDSREAYRVYKACLKNARKLRDFIGHSLMAELLDCVE